MNINKIGTKSCVRGNLRHHIPIEQNIVISVSTTFFHFTASYRNDEQEIVYCVGK